MGVEMAGNVSKKECLKDIKTEQNNNGVKCSEIQIGDRNVDARKISALEYAGG